MKQLQLLIKPASSMCNLGCSYCFYKDEADHRECESLGIMEDKVRRMLIKNALSCSSECIFAFQGGEPALAGLPWFQNFVKEVEEQKKPNQNIQYTIQTNGLLLDEAWMDFLEKNHFLVGLSLDGTKEIHDKYRKNMQGEGTFDQVYQVAKHLQKRGVEFNILTVLTGEAAGKIKEIYEFYKKEGFFYQQYIPCLDPLGEKPGSCAYSLHPEKYEDFLKELFDLWFQDTVRGETWLIRQFENWMMTLAGGEPEACSMCGKCSMQNVIEANGDVYPCDFYALDEHLVGNVMEHTFEELEKRAKKLEFFKEERQRDWKCGECRYYPLCRGGCRREVFFDGKKYHQYYCQAYESFFKYALYKMEWLLRE